MGAKGIAQRSRYYWRATDGKPVDESYRTRWEKHLAAIVSAACDRWLAKHEHRTPTDYDRVNRRKAFDKAQDK